MVKRVIAYLLSVIVAAALGTIAHTQLNLNALAALGAEMPIGVRVQSTIADLAGMAPLYGGLIAIGFLVAFLVAGFLARYLSTLRTLVFIGAAAVAIATIHILLSATLGVTPIASTRTATGFAAQLIAGGIAGYLFAAFTRPPSALTPQAR